MLGKPGLMGVDKAGWLQEGQGWRIMESVRKHYF